MADADGMLVRMGQQFLTRMQNPNGLDIEAVS
jgi:hypothetical protein